MLRFALQRVLVALAVVLGAASATFFVFRLLRPEVTAAGSSVLGDYASFMGALLQGDLGRSLDNGNRPVVEVIAEGLPADLWLIAGGMVAGVVMGLAGGAVCGAAPRAWWSRVLEGAALLALCAPVYWVGLVAILLFSGDIGVVPVPFLGGQGTYRPLGEDPVAWAQGLLMPWVVLGLPVAGACLRMLRASMQDVIDEDFTRTALGKGLRWRRVLRRHVVPVGAPPVLALSGALSAAMVSNAVLIEQTFNIPGALRGLTGASGTAEGDALDVAMLQGVTLAGAVLVILAILVAELLHGLLDPRVRA